MHAHLLTTSIQQGRPPLRRRTADTRAFRGRPGIDAGGLGRAVSELTLEIVRVLRRRRGDDQGLQREPYGSARRGVARASSSRSGRRTRNADLAGRSAAPAWRFSSVSLSHLPHAWRRGNGTVPGFLLRPRDHFRASAEAGQRPADPHRRAGIAHHRQGRHADDGRADDPVRPVLLDAAVGQSRQPLCLGGALGHARLRPDRLLRRLSESQETDARRLYRPHAPGHRSGHRGDSPASPWSSSADRPFSTSLVFPFFKELRDQFRLVLPAVRRLHHRWRRQRGEPDRRPRRARHRSGDDRRPRASA